MYEFDFSSGQGYGSPFAPRAVQKLSSSRAWYAAVVPLIGLFIEILADSIYLGALVWITCAVSCVAACVLDRRYLGAQAIDLTALKPCTAYIPPLYLYKRAVLLNANPTQIIVFIISFIVALSSNGFTMARMMDEDDAAGEVRNNYLVNVESFENTQPTKTIEELLKLYSKDHLGAQKLEWSAERGDGAVTVGAVSERKDFEIVFSIEFDGYAFGMITVEKITENSKTYEDERALEKFKKMMKSVSGDTDKDNANKTGGAKKALAERNGLPR